MKIFFNERIMLHGEDWIPESEAEFNENIDNLIKTLSSYNYIPEASIFFSAIDINRLISNIEKVLDLFDYSITNPIDKLRHILYQIEASNWHDQKKQVIDHSYYFISNKGTSNVYINDTTISEAFENILLGNTVCLINFISSEFNDSNPLDIFKRNVNPPNETTFNKVSFITHQNQAISHYHENRLERKYNWNPKHGENGKNVKHNKSEIVSPLEVSIGEASELLKSALGCRKTNELYAFDKKVQKFMVFKCESKEQSVFHSYHPINQNEINEDIKKFIDNLNH